VNNIKLKIESGDLLTSTIIAASPVKNIFPEEIDSLILNGQDITEAIDFSDLEDIDDDEDAPVYTGPQGKVSYKEWTELTKHGCAQCVSNLEHSDHNTMVWVDAFTPLCPDCSCKMTAPITH